MPNNVNTPLPQGKPTRGEFNLNPGNINVGGGWRGELGHEIVPAGSSYKPRFARFDTAENGIRAIGKQLLAYRNKHNLKTVRTMIDRWAPPADHNDTSTYVSTVCNACGVKPDDVIDITNETVLTKMVTAIIRQENGRVSYSTEVIATACHIALRS